MCETEARDDFVRRLALLKRNALAAPFERAFRTQKELEASAAAQSQLGELMAVHYRDEEAIYVQAAPDRVTVFFSTVFREETDRVFGKVFLQVGWCVGLYSSWTYDGCRNSLMHDGSKHFRTRHRYSTQTETRPSSCAASQDSRPATTRVMSRSVRPALFLPSVLT